MNLLKEILASPVEYANDAVLALIAQQLMPKPEIEGATHQMNQAANKDIEQVMSSQRQLIDVVGKFTPKIVKMDG